LISFSVLNSWERKHFWRFLHQSLVCWVKSNKNEKYWFLRCDIWEIIEWRKKMKIWVSSSFSRSWKGFCYQFRPSPTWTSHVSIWRGKTKWHMIRFNRSLTFWTCMTNGTDIAGVFGSFSWSKDVSDSEVHFQGLKWGFTPFKI